MTIKPTPTDPHASIVQSPLELKEIAEILVKHYGLHEGLYDLAIEFQIGVGPVGHGGEAPLPGGIVAVKKIGLMRTTKTGGSAVVDASVINPIKKPRN